MTIRTALSLFTVLPVSGPVELTREAAVRAVRWLPAVGALLGIVAGSALWLVAAAVSGPFTSLFAATVAIAVLATLSGGLHLDGLADTADGLASRRPPAHALEIMRRSDVGPLGVATLIFAILLQVSALASLTHGLPAAGAVFIAAVTGRTAVVLAAGRDVPAARPDGFGAFIAGSLRRPERTAIAVAAAAAVAGAGLAVGGLAGARTAGAMLTGGLLAGFAVRSLAQRRLGGVTGDVFGAVVEVSTTAALVAAALV